MGLLILPMKRMLLVVVSMMKTKNGLSIFMVDVKAEDAPWRTVAADASVPSSVTLSVVLWDTCGGKRTRETV